MSDDFHVKLEQARARLPLRRLMEQYGRSPGNGTGKSFKCPYCHKKGASIFGTPEMFKCFHTSCPSGTAGEKCSFDEIGFLQHELNLTRSEACKTYFKEAGVWKERESHAPSVMPGQRARKNKFPEPPKPDLPPPEKSPSQPVSETSESAPLSAGRSSASEESSLVVDGSALPESKPVASELNAPPPEVHSAGGGASLSDSRAETALEAPAGGGPDTQSAEARLPAVSMMEGIEKFFEYLGNLKRNRFRFKDLAGSFPPELAAELLRWMGELKLVVPVGEDEYEIQPDWKQKLRPTQEAHPAPPSPVPDNVIPLHGGGTPPPKNPKEDLPPGPPPLSALRWFYRRLHLSDSDLNHLWLKRGLHAGTCRALGYRSNPESNKALLEQMPALYPMMVLLDCGLFLEGDKPSDSPKPNAQFYGMSVREKRDEHGKKMRNEHGKPMNELVWDHPILIPYFDEEGELIHLRPHKGMIKDKPMRLYVARPCKEFLLAQTKPLPQPQFALMSEGEFKAGALWQVLADQAAVASLPGITMAKPLFGDVEEWLDKTNVRRIVIGYDNEEKSDPKLPGYKKDEWKRFDAEVWARYLARQLAKEGYEAKVARLPNEWRDSKGKADWDGRLAQLVHGSEQPADLLMPEDTVEKWSFVHPTAREQFLFVINGAGVVNELWQMGFFEGQEERIIKNQLEKISYEPRLGIGGDSEITIARRLMRLCAKTKGTDRMVPKARGFLMMLATAYQETRGGYYIFKNLSERIEAEWHLRLAKSVDEGDTEVKRACELALKGIPSRISDFYLKAHYVLNQIKGTRCRLVTIHSMHGVTTELKSLPSAPFAQPSKFREWLLDNCTVATWRAGERELQDLHADIGREVAFKDVAEVVIRGHHADSKLWFYKDVVYTPEGKELFADKNGITWFDGRAYRLADKDHETQTFRHQEPMMHPEVKMKKEEGKQLFVDIATKLFDTIGGFDGWLAFGMVLAYAAAPEIYGSFNGYPGLWLHGETQQGKTSVALWLMRIWGYSIKQGMALKDSTKVGLSILLQQYGNLPVFLEEFQPSAEEWQVEKMKNIFDRVSGSKKTFDEGDRKIIAGAIVTGIATSRDAQVKNRYAHVQVSSANRLENHYDWFQNNCDRFFLIGRFLMRNRKEYAAAVIAGMREWKSMKELEGIDERARIVHGAGYAAFKAMNDMLDAFQEQGLKEYREHLIIHSAQSVKEIHEQVNVNQFWHLLLNALTGDAFGHTPGERSMVFKVRETPKPKPMLTTAEQVALGKTPKLTPDQIKAGEESSPKKWTSYLLYFRPGPVIDMVRGYMRQQGRELPLEKNDLRAQMETRPYWVNTGELGTAKYPDNVHRMKFGHASKTPQSCWCINLDEHELGFRAVSDAEFQESIYADQKAGVFIPTDEWMDPRKGDLFALVDSLKSQREAAGEGGQ